MKKTITVQGLNWRRDGDKVAYLEGCDILVVGNGGDGGEEDRGSKLGGHSRKVRGTGSERRGGRGEWREPGREETEEAGARRKFDTEKTRSFDVLPPDLMASLSDDLELKMW
eukprot:757251-Hanusia_phi.AAC.1